MKTLSICSLAFLFSVGCGDDEVLPQNPDASSPDAPTSDAGVPTSTAFVVAGDFGAGSGIASTIGVPGLEVETNVVAGVVSSDPVVAAVGDFVIVVNRFGADNIAVLDRSTFSLVEQVSIGANSNPQGVASANGKLYVATFSGVGVSVVAENDLAGGVASTVDLSANDPDGNPNCASIVESGGLIYVACQLLDDALFTPRGPGIVVIIDPSDDSIVDTLTLTNENPFSVLVPTPAGGAFGGDVLVATVPDFATYTAGCIERIETSPPAVGACLVTNQTLGGHVSDMIVSGDQVLAAITTCQGGDCFGNPTIADIAIIEASGAVSATFATASSHPTDIERCPTGEVIVSDTDYPDSPGVRVYDAAGTELTSTPLDIGLAPAFANSIACF